MAVQAMKESRVHQFDATKARTILLRVIQSLEKSGQAYMQIEPAISRIRSELKVKDSDSEKAVLTMWYDLFRNGVLAPGFNFKNPSLPFFHLTDKGRKTLSVLSRDPSNPDGYMTLLRDYKLDDAIAISYTEEALNAYVNGCPKSAVVMIGCASERIVMMVRDELRNGLKRQSRRIPDQLNDWRYKIVRDAITVELDSKRTVMPQKLKESYTSFWVPCTEQMRQHRNDAGHPQSVAPVSDETVHANLLLFPTFAKLAYDVKKWFKASYKKK